MKTNPTMPATAVPPRYRGVWRRTLLQADGVRDVDTTVFWLQTNEWHADLRIPADRPDFSGVQSLADCDREQLAWLAQQQGFAGITQIDDSVQPEICRWHRLLDYCPPAATPDAGYMQFAATHLVETGVHAAYLEHWLSVGRSHAGFAVLQRSDEQARQQFLMVAGDYVMHVRERSMALPLDFAMAQLDDAALRAALDFEISFGERTPDGWIVRHSTLPWLEGKRSALTITRRDALSLEMTWDGTPMFWQVLEWMPPD